MEARAKLTMARLSPRKTRLVVDMIRGRGIQDALTILKFSPQPSAKLVAKLLNSAVANAEQKGASDVDRLFVKTVFVDGGAVLKRFTPRAMGRASKIRKPTSHITVVVADTK
jgi:large subunit ribosomal protein L22